MALLHSNRTQLMALRGMCSRDLKVSGALLSCLDDSHFAGNESQEALNVIRRYIRAHGNPPAFRVLAEDLKLSQKTRDYLAEADVSPKSTEQAQQVVERLNQYRHSRIFYSLCKEGLEKLQQDKVDPEELISMAQTSLAAMQLNKDAESQLFHIGRDGNANDLMQKVLYEPDDDNWIPTGWKTWDQDNGGMPRGSLVTIGGSSGSGKSHCILQLAKTQALLGYKVVVVPLEMSEEELATRLLANIGATDSLKISLKRLAADEQDFLWRKYRRFHKKVESAGGRFTIYRPTSDVTIEETMAAVHSFNPDVIYIDYIGLLKGADGDDQWRQLGNIARYGKVYAGSHKKVVVLAAQVNEDGKIRYSQAIREHSSLAWTFVATKESREQGFLNFETIKSRNQMAKNFTLKVSYATSTLKDLDPSENIEPIDQNANRAAAKKTAGAKDKSDEKPTSFMPDMDD